MNSVLNLGYVEEKTRSPTQKGEKQGEAELKKLEKNENEKLNELLKRSSDILFSAKSFFPFDLFPTEVVVTIHKVDVIYNSFFNRRIQPVYIQNISDVYVNTGFMFSSLHIIDIGFTNNTLEIDNLKNEDAVEALKIIQGLVVSVKQRIDLTKVKTNNFVEKMKSLATPAGSY